jgi:hypothetical protein
MRNASQIAVAVFALAVVVVSAACEEAATLEEASEVVACQSVIDEGLLCSAACALRPLERGDDTCVARDVDDGFLRTVERFATWRGLRGYCFLNNIADHDNPVRPVPDIVFAICD